MSKGVRFYEFGGPEVLRYEVLTLDALAPDEARVRHAAIGLNFIDTYQRSGLYKVPLPCIGGSEAAGIVEAVGSNVTHVKVGDRVAYVSDSPGRIVKCVISPRSACANCQKPFLLSKPLR